MKKTSLIIYLALASVFAIAQWTALSSGTNFPLNSIYFPDANTGYAVGGLDDIEGTILKTTNGGLTWESQTSGINMPLWTVYFTDENTGFTAGGNYVGIGEGFLLRTTNGGATWTEIPGVTNYCIMSIVFTDANTGYGAGGYSEGSGLIIKSTDGGLTWDISLGGNSNSYYSIYFVDENTGYVAGGYGCIMKTTNAGATWTQLSTGTNDYFSSVYFTDTLNGCVVGTFGTIFRTEDGGLSWEAIPSGTNNSLWSVFFSDNNIGYSTGIWGTIIKTANGGKTWTVLNSGVNQFLTSVYFTDNFTGYVAGWEGTILKTTNGGGLMPIFNSSDTEACVEGTIQYYDQSSGDPTSWNWTFEGGTPATSNEQNPVVIYINPGIFDVSLTVSNGFESDTLVMEDYINISDEPQIPGTPDGENEVCTNWTFQSIYTSTGANYSESYEWEILPVEAGIISGNGLTATVTWTFCWEGNASIKVKGYNEICGEGEYSEGLNVDCVFCDGTREQNDLSGILICPNPTNNKIIISINDESLENLIVSIYNIHGERVLYENFQNQKQIEIDVSNLPRGIYLVKMQMNGGIEVKKLVIQ